MSAPQQAPQLVHIPQSAPDSSPRARAQREFNQLSERIAGLEAEAGAFRAAATELRRRVQDEYRPLQLRHHEQRATLVRVLAEALAHYKLTRTEQAKAADLLVRSGHDLPAKGFADLQPLLDQYAPPPPSATETRAAAQQGADELLRNYRRQYGIEFDPAADLSTPAQVHAYVRTLAEQAQAAAQAGQQARAARRAARPKSPRQQAAAAQQQAQAQGSTKAVRTLYLDLVKHLHPDREREEAEKIRKTELLKQVTTAYEAGELLTLLRLQLELQRINQAQLATLADEQLRYYNALLREQARELTQAMLDEQQRLAAFTGRPPARTASPAAMQADYERQKQQLLARTQQLAADVQAFAQGPAALKAWLKTYQLPPAG